MTARPSQVKAELDMESFFDFNGSTTPSKAEATPKTAAQDWNQTSHFEMREEQQQFSGPSHDYQQYKQQVGLPAGSVANMPSMSTSGMFDGYNSGIGDMSFDGNMSGWASGIDMDTDMNMDFNQPSSSVPATFFSSQGKECHNLVVNPTTIGDQDESASQVGRLWPGMHSQRAHQDAMQKAAQVQAMQQRQMKLQAQHAQYRQAPPQQQQQQAAGNGKRPARANDPVVEQSISRLLSQMRQNSTVSSASDDQNGLLPHIARLKKDEEEMDDDERMLASEEGKKLSSKERRQLRNKVSARAFRSRRKEYISQLEGEVAMKAQECADFRNHNIALIQENERYRALIEVVLRHPSFNTFLNDLSEDPSVLGILDNQQAPPTQQQPQSNQPAVMPAQHAPQAQTGPQPQPQPQPQQQQQGIKPEFLNFDASQLQLPQQQGQQSETVRVAILPENDFSKLNINGFKSMDFNSYRSVNAFAVTDLPDGPDPVDILSFDTPLRSASPNGFAATFSNAAHSQMPFNDMTTLLAKLDGAARNLSADVSA